MSLPEFKYPPKVLVTKIGLDGHDRGSRVVAAFLRDAGMDVLYTPPWQEIGQVVRLAEEEDVDVIGISSLATDHLLVPKLKLGFRIIAFEIEPAFGLGLRLAYFHDPQQLAAYAFRYGDATLTTPLIESGFVGMERLRDQFRNAG